MRMHRINPKSVISCPNGWYSDGNNLYLRVVGDQRYWVFRSTSSGQRVVYTIGKYPFISLKQAREEAIRLKYLDRTEPKLHPKQRVEKVLFKDFYLKALKNLVELKTWKNPERIQKMFRSRMARYVLPVIGDKSVDAITTGDVLAVLKPMWEQTPMLCKELRLDIHRVCAYAISLGVRTNPNPAEWKGNLELALPRLSKVHNTTHNTRVDEDKLQDTIAEMCDKSVTGYCAIFGVLTATRRVEFTKAEWSEIDFEAKVWSIPSSRRKDNKPEPFRVPLSDQAISILQLLPRGGKCIFGSTAYHSIGYFYCREHKFNFTIHGMRSVFRDWGQERQKDFVLMEKSLCHAVGNSVTQAYQRSDCLELRRPIMQEWADFCCAKLKLTPVL